MALIRLNSNPSASDLRLFALLWLIFIGGIGAIALHRGSMPTALVWWSAAGAVAIPGLIAPRSVRLVYIGATYATYPIGFVVSALILAAFYFLVLTPVGIVVRLLRRDPLDRAFDRSRSTYWESRDPAPPVDSYFRQHL
ncbi:MAG: SxtJ family membrane protein [Opitutus sp.]